jgi:carbon monoxide dehydrogenase subunit G
VDTGLVRVMYVNDPDGFSVEMLYARRALWGLSGFVPGGGYVQNEVSIRAPREAVWQRLIDHADLGSWTPFKGQVLRAGRKARDGPGCLRELTALGVRITEEVVDWEQGHRYTYRLLTGAPFRWHRGDIFLAEENGITRVRWAIQFESRLPFTSGLIARALQFLFGRALAKLQRQLEAQ